MKKALIVVDIQNDFCEGGALAVNGGTTVAADVAQLIRETTDYYSEVVFTQDWHKPLPDTNGGHFGDPPDFVDSWPVHCVAGTGGAEIHSDLTDLVTNVFKKGYGRPDYSGFQGFNVDGQSLDEFLSSRDIGVVHVCGLAADYCVRETALDSIRLGYDTLMLPSHTAAIAENGIWETTMRIESLRND